MATQSPLEEPDHLECHRCGYDLRAHPEDGKCPECEASVAESRRLAKIPHRPTWRKSDPRWRRRMLAGAWILVCLPLLDVLQFSGCAARIHVPCLIGLPDHVETLGESFLASHWVYQPVVFCIGVVLLFAKERGRQPNRLDWTRRWGIFCSYVTFLLSAVPILLVTAMVGIGIAATFLSMPPKYQPAITDPLLKVSATYIRYGPHPSESAEAVHVIFSSVAVLLACIPLFNALRSTGLKYVAVILLAPLPLFALFHFVLVARYCFGSSTVTVEQLYPYGVYFQPTVLIDRFPHVLTDWTFDLTAFLAEFLKWSIFLAIAVWLSIALIWPLKAARARSE